MLALLNLSQGKSGLAGESCGSTWTSVRFPNIVICEILLTKKLLKLQEQTPRAV